MDTEHSPLFVKSEITNVNVTGDLLYLTASEEGKLGNVRCNGVLASITGERIIDANTKAKEWTASVPLTQEGVNDIQCAYKKDFNVHERPTRVFWSGPNKDVDFQIRLSNPNERTYEFVAIPKTGLTLSNLNWSFSDNSTDVGNNRYKSFQAIGNYTVSLSVKDQTNKSYSITKNFTVLPITPKIDFQYFITGTVETDDETNIDLRSFDYNSIASGSISSCSWDLGNGVTKSTMNATHLFTDSRTYQVTLSCTSDANVTNSITKSIVIEEGYDPVADFDFTVNPSNTLIVDATISSDPEGKTLSYEWNFGEGSGWISGMSSNVMWGYDEGGTYNVQLKVTNSLGFSTTISKSINMGPTAPPAQIDVTYDYRGMGNQAEITFYTQANLPNNGYIINWDWNYGDGSPINSGFIPNTYHYYTAGTYQMSVVMTDNQNNQTTITKEITIYDDYTWPWIQYDAQGEGYMATVKDPSFFLNFQLDDTSPTTVQIFNNGLPVITYNIPANSYSVVYDPEINLNEGPNFIEVRATDAAGNVYNRQLYRTLDSTPPQLLSLTPSNGSIINEIDNLRLIGSSNEILSAAYFNDELIELTNNNKDFDIPLVYRVGENFYELKLIDALGNEVVLSHSNTVIISLLNKGLISIVPHTDPDKIVVSGLPGSVRTGSTVEISGGFFNSEDVEVQPDGSWSGILDFAEEIEVTADNADLDYQETVALNYNVDTTLSGIIKDPADNPLPGVTVTIVSSGQSVISNAAGVFSISKPALGDQDLKIDGSTIPTQITNGLQEFSAVHMKVSIGNKQQNVIERTIYISPKITDGTETEVLVNTAVQVTSSHAPGVVIDIPAGKALFPGGTQTGTINISEIPAEKTSVEMPEGIVPQNVYALEPSGLKFSEPVHLTLPNDNDFPEGIELVILSKNSSTGLWEVDGSATVTSSGNIETKPGQGISHFSEVFAAPFGMKMTAMGDKDKPGISNDIGVLTTKVEMPSYLRMGQSITPTMIYKSSWAYPNASISNIFNLPREKYVKSDSGGGNFLGIIQGHQTGTVTTWITPESIDTQTYVGEYSSGKVTFEAESAPKEAVVTYGVDLSELESGVYPALSEYEIKYRNLTISTTKKTERKLFGAAKTKVTSKVERDILESIFPPELRSTLYHQNKINSEYGHGWKFALNQQIVNPSDDRLMIENEDGSVSSYVLQTTVEKVATDTDGIESVSFKNGKLFYADQKGNIYLKNDGDPSPSLYTQTQNYVGSLGVNSVKVTSQATYCCKSGWSGCTKRCPKYYNLCEKSTYAFNLSKKIHNVIDLGGDNVLFLDQYGAIWQNQVSENVAAGLVANIGRVESSTGEINSGCQNILQNSCDTLTRTSYTTTSSSSNDKPWVLSQCGTMVNSTGYFPVMGYSAAGITSSKFNKPLSMIQSGNGSTLIVADTGNNVVRKVFLNSNSTSIIAGNQQTYDNGDGGPAIAASLYHPRGLALDSLGNIYVSTERGFIRKIDPEGNISTIAGKPLNQGGQLVQSGPMDKFNLNTPSALSLDEDNGYLYVADTGNHRIVQIDLIDSIAKVVAGVGTCTTNAAERTGIPALEENICSPLEIALDTEKNLLFVDKNTNSIKKILLNNGSNGIQRYASTVKDNSILLRKQDGSFERQLRNGTKFLFSAEGLHLSTVDRTNRSTEFSYDQNKRLISFTDPSGSQSTLTYSGPRLTEFVDAAQRSTSFSYDGEGRLTEIEFPDSTTKSFNYDSNNLLTQEVNQRGFATTYGYNDLKKLSTVTTPDNATTELQDAISKTFYNSIDGSSRKLVNYNESQEEGITDKVVNAKGATTTFVKETNGYVSKIIGADGKETVIERDSEGRPTKITKPDLTFTTFVYDQQKGDLISRFESSSNSSESFTYDEYGNLRFYTSPLGKVSEKKYDLVTGLLVKEIDPRGNFVTYSYDNSGLISAKTNSASQTQQYFYNTQGNLSKTKMPMGEEVLISRDSAGNILTKTNAKNETTYYSFDSFNKLMTVTTALNKTTSYSYLATGELTGVLTPTGATTSFEYNSVGRLTKKTSPKGQVTKLSYDNVGNVTQEIDPAGHIKTFEYNLLNKLIRKVLPDNEYLFTYTDSGILNSVSDNHSSFEYDYSTIHGKEYLTGITMAVDSLPTSTMNYSYSADGILQGMTSAYLNVSYGFNQSSMLNSVTTSTGHNFAYTYDNADRLTSMASGNLLTTFSYDSNSFLEDISFKVNNSISSQFQYSRDPNSNRTSLTTNAGVYNYSYDSTGQLTSASNPEADAAHALESFAYDDLGNRTSDNQGLYSYDTQKFQLEEDWKYVYAYDLNGNLITKQEKGFTGRVQNFVYNSENQLVQIDFHDNGLTTKQIFFTYDALGRRVKKRILENNSEVVRKYVYDANEVIAILNDENDVLVKYTHSGLRTDDVLSMQVTTDGVNAGVAQNSGTFQFVKDGLGSIIDVVDSSGTKVQHYSYSSFGKLLKIEDGGGNDISANPILEPHYSYTGREFDKESGLFYYRARYYDAHSGRFIQEDSYPGIGTSPQTFNSKYIYALNVPTVFTDPSGKIVPAIVLAGMAVGGIFAGYRASQQNGADFWSILGSSLQGALIGGTVSYATVVGAGLAAGGAGFMAATSEALSSAIIAGFANGALGLIFSGGDPKSFAYGFVDAFAITFASGVASYFVGKIMSELATKTASLGAETFLSSQESAAAPKMIDPNSCALRAAGRMILNMASFAGETGCTPP